MSNVSNTHNVATLDKKSKAFDGQRMARVIAKANKSGEYESENLKESKFVSVPMIAPEFTQSQLVQLMPHIVGILADAQDAIIRERIIDGATAINDAEISVDACIQYLDDQSKGNRITKEYLQKWFTDTFYESAMEFVCMNAKFDPNELTPAQATVVEQKANVLRDMFSGFSGARYSPEIPQCKAMIKFGEFLGNENQDAKMQNYVAKAAKVLKEKTEAMSMDALGF